MRSFASDNNSSVHPRIIKFLIGKGKEFIKRKKKFAVPLRINIFVTVVTVTTVTNIIH